MAFRALFAEVRPQPLASLHAGSLEEGASPVALRRPSSACTRSRATLARCALFTLASALTVVGTGCRRDDGGSSASEADDAPNGKGDQARDSGAGSGGGGKGAGPSPSEPEPEPSEPEATADDDEPPTGFATIQLKGFPHQIDVYASSGATRALIMLHGGGGTSEGSAVSLGLQESNSEPENEPEDDADLTFPKAHDLVVFFPDGQSVDGSPNASTWSNHVMDSGQDDVAFLQKLADYARRTYELDEVYLVGHSNGGMMANRMWCESPDTFDAYVAIAGPASTYYASDDSRCAPKVFRPYFGIVGDSDSVLGVSADTWEAPTWEVNKLLVAVSGDAFIDPTLIGEWERQQWRAKTVCGEELSADDAEKSGNSDVWSSCEGRLRLQRVGGADHAIESLEARARIGMLDLAMTFIDSL